MDASRTIIETDNSTLELNSSEELRVKDSGITTAKLAANCVTAAKKAALTQNESSSSGNFTTTSTSFTSVTNLSTAITTTGRPVMIMLRSDGSGSASGFKGKSTNGSEMRFLRGGTEIARQFIGGFNTGWQGTATPLFHIETSLAAGTYTYTVEIKAVSSADTYCDYFKLLAFEL